MAILTRNGVHIYYEDRGSGPAVLLSHGYGATSRMWHGQIEVLARDYRVITWDMRGHGQSDSPDDPAAYSEAATCDDIAGILSHLSIPNAVIGGLSLGGYMSLAFHLAYPALTRALLLFDTGPGYKNDASREAWNRTAFQRAESFESRGLTAVGRSPEVQASRHKSAVGLAHAARGMLAQFDSRVIESLPEIKVPTLVLAGENDAPFLNGTDYMAARIPNATKVIIPDAGHAANIDQPAAFNQAVVEFLGRLQDPAD